MKLTFIRVLAVVAAFGVFYNALGVVFTPQKHHCAVGLLIEILCFWYWITMHRAEVSK